MIFRPLFLHTPLPPPSIILSPCNHYSSSLDYPVSLQPLLPLLLPRLSCLPATTTPPPPPSIILSPCNHYSPSSSQNLLLPISLQQSPQKSSSFKGRMAQNTPLLFRIEVGCLVKSSLKRESHLFESQYYLL